MGWCNNIPIQWPRVQVYHIIRMVLQLTDKWIIFTSLLLLLCLSGTIGQSVVCLTAEPGGCKFKSQPSHTTFVKIDNKIFFMVILPHLLIQGGHLSITGKSMCTKYMYWLTHCSWETRKRVLGKQCRPRSDAAECSV